MKLYKKLLSRKKAKNQTSASATKIIVKEKSKVESSIN